MKRGETLDSSKNINDSKSSHTSLKANNVTVVVF